MAASALKVDIKSTTHRVLAHAQIEYDRVMDQLEVLKRENMLPPANLVRQRMLLEAEISTLISDFEG